MFFFILARHILIYKYFLLFVHYLYFLTGTEKLNWKNAEHAVLHLNVDEKNNFYFLNNLFPLICQCFVLILANEFMWRVRQDEEH